MPSLHLMMRGNEEKMGKEADKGYPTNSLKRTLE